VAIEHPKDADLAAGIVLAEVIPFVSKKLPLATPPSDNAHGAPLNVEGGVAPPQDNAHGAPLNVQGGVAPPQDNAHGAPLNVQGGVAPPQDNAHVAPLNVEGGVAPPQDNAHGAPLNVQGGVASFVLSFLFLYHCTLFALVWFTNVSFVTCLKCS